MFCVLSVCVCVCAQATTSKTQPSTTEADSTGHKERCETKTHAKCSVIQPQRDERQTEYYGLEKNDASEWERASESVKKGILEILAIMNYYRRKCISFSVNTKYRKKNCHKEMCMENTSERSSPANTNSVVACISKRWMCFRLLFFFLCVLCFRAAFRKWYCTRTTRGHTVQPVSLQPNFGRCCCCCWYSWCIWRGRDLCWFASRVHTFCTIILPNVAYIRTVGAVSSNRIFGMLRSYCCWSSMFHGTMANMHTDEESDRIIAVRELYLFGASRLSRHTALHVLR